MTGQVIWLTGLSGAGKTTVAQVTNLRLRKLGMHPILLDGDILRTLLKSTNSDTETYNRAERIKFALVYSQICKILSSQGFTVIIATVSMFQEVYIWNRTNLLNYFEIYLNVPLDELRRRDPKRIYQRYDAGELINVAGLDLPVDEPFEPHITIDFAENSSLWRSPKVTAEYLISELKKVGFKVTI